MPFVLTEKEIAIENNELFYTFKKYLKGRSSLNDCQYVRTVILSSTALKELDSL